MFILVFVLPLCSVIITYYCKKYYFPIYFVVVVAICLLIDLPDTIFYVIPSLITGFIFGLFVDKKIQPIFSILLATVVQFGISLAFIPLIKVLTNRDIIYDMATIFHLVDYIYLDYVVISIESTLRGIVPSILFFISVLIRDINAFCVIGTSFIS